MKDCPVDGKIVSRLPDYARGSHGDLAEQNRRIGPVRGTALAAGTAAQGPTLALVGQESAARALAESSGCLACHGAAMRIVGPSLVEIAARYRSDDGVEARLMAKVRSGGQGAWGAVPMPPQPGLQDGEVRALVRWILTGVQ